MSATARRPPEIVSARTPYPFAATGSSISISRRKVAHSVRINRVGWPGLGWRTLLHTRIKRRPGA